MLSMSNKMIESKPGRPRAISDDLIPVVTSFYNNGLGYRAIARELMNRGVSVDWSTVRRVIKREQGGNGYHNAPNSTSNTILPRGTSEE